MHDEPSRHQRWVAIETALRARSGRAYVAISIVIVGAAAAYASVSSSIARFLLLALLGACSGVLLFLLRPGHAIDKRVLAAVALPFAIVGAYVNFDSLQAGQFSSGRNKSDTGRPPTVTRIQPPPHSASIAGLPIWIPEGVTLGGVTPAILMSNLTRGRYWWDSRAPHDSGGFFSTPEIGDVMLVRMRLQGAGRRVAFHVTTGTTTNAGRVNLQGAVEYPGMRFVEIETVARRRSAEPPPVRVAYLASSTQVRDAQGRVRTSLPDGIFDADGVVIRGFARGEVRYVDSRYRVEPLADTGRSSLVSSLVCQAPINSRVTEIPAVQAASGRFVCWVMLANIGSATLHNLRVKLSVLDGTQESGSRITLNVGVFAPDAVPQTAQTTDDFLESKVIRVTDQTGWSARPYEKSLPLVDASGVVFATLRNSLFVSEVLTDSSLRNSSSGIVLSELPAGWSSRRYVQFRLMFRRSSRPTGSYYSGGQIL